MTCLNCRIRHIKCDSASPTCNRCVQSNLRCHYVASRRGRKTRPALALAAETINSPPIDAVGSLASTSELSFDFEHSLIYPNDSTHSATSLLELLEEESMGIQPLILPHSQVRAESCIIGSTETWIHNYYRYFHKAHPFLLPLQHLSIAGCPDYLLNAMRIASLQYVSPRPSHEEVASLAASLQFEVDVLSKAQAFLILAILSHSTGEPISARHCLSEAARTALAIGINQENPPSILLTADNVHFESARRTWWELFIIDCLLATFQKGGSFVMAGDCSAALLPVEEEMYNRGEFRLSDFSLQDLRDRVFSNTGDALSTFAYRTEAALLLRDVLTLVRSGNDLHGDRYHMLDSRIVTWFNSIPVTKQELMDHNGNTAEMMFQAHLMACLAAITLSIGQSVLLSPLATIRNILCGTNHARSSYIDSETVHTLKVLKAADQISDLARLPSPILEHTPFFTCFLVVGSMIHLAACSMLESSRAEKHRTLLGLNISILQTLGKVWPLALHSRDRLREAALEIREFQAGLVLSA